MTLTTHSSLLHISSAQRTTFLIRITFPPFFPRLPVQLLHRGDPPFSRRSQPLPPRLERLHVLLVNLYQSFGRRVIRVKRLRNGLPLLSVSEARNRDLFGGENDTMQLEKGKRERVDGGGDGFEGVA